MTEIRHIVFDIGKVLVHYDPDLPFSRLIPDEAERKWFFDNVCTSAWNSSEENCVTTPCSFNLRAMSWSIDAPPGRSFTVVFAAASECFAP